MGTGEFRNLRTLLNHEFGHALNLGHATDTTVQTNPVTTAIIAVGANAAFGKSQQPWNWDEDCSDMYNLGRQDVVWARGSTETVTSPALEFFNNTFHMAWKRAHTSSFGVQYAWRTAAYASWSATSTVSSNVIDSPTYLYKNGADSALVWTQIQ